MSICDGACAIKQKEYLQENVEIVIATPDRLYEFVICGDINLSDVTLLILDDPVYMLNMDFESQIHVSLYNVRSDRQTIMTSATWSSAAKDLASSFTTNAIQVVIETTDKSIKQAIPNELQNRANLSEAYQRR